MEKTDSIPTVRSVLDGATDALLAIVSGLLLKIDLHFGNEPEADGSRSLDADCVSWEEIDTGDFHLTEVIRAKDGSLSFQTDAPKGKPVQPCLSFDELVILAQAFEDTAKKYGLV